MKKLFLGLGLLVVALSSCSVPKTIIAEDMVENLPYPITNVPEVHIQKGDKLSVIVNSSTPELAMPFNVVGSVVTADSKGDINTVQTGASNFREPGYIVDPDGNIDFPYLGKIRVEGFTRTQLADQVKVLLIREKLVSDPIVTVELLNLKVIMMGETNNRVLSSPDGQMTILQALAQSGLTSNSMPEEIKVFREDGRQRRMIIVNICKKDVFDSEGYYLQQNDIVFVSPRSNPMSAKEDRGWRYISVMTSLVSLAMAIVTFIKVK